MRGGGLIRGKSYAKLGMGPGAGQPNKVVILTDGFHHASSNNLIILSFIP